MSNLESVSSASSPPPIFAALGDVTRLELVSRLGKEQPLSIAQLAEGLQLTRQGVTKHLRVLERAGLVAAERSGREKHYVCRPEPISDARAYLDEVSDQWGAALGRLKSYVVPD